MFDTLYEQITGVTWVAVCAFALLKGEQAEKIGGAALLVGWLASLSIQRQVGTAQSAIPLMAIDVVLLLVLLSLAWKSERSWPIWGSAFQLMTVLVSVISASDLRVWTVAYVSAVLVATYGLLICLAVGTFWSWQEREAIKPRE